MKHALALNAAAATLALAACTGAPDTRASGIVVRDSAGVQIVEQSAAYVAALPVWTIDSIPLAQVAGNAPDNTFSLINDAMQRRDGRFVVADQQQRDIREFTPAGRFARVIARAGRGPGEVGYVERLQLLPGDTLAYIDANNRRLTIFAPDGQFSRQHLYPRFAASNVRFTARLDDGRILGVMRTPFVPSAVVVDSVYRKPFAIVAFHTVLDTTAAATAPVDTLAVVPDLEVYAGTTVEGGETWPDEYPLRFGRNTTIATDGRRVFIGANEPRGIMEYSGGRLVRHIRNGTLPVPVTETDRGRLFDEVIAGLQQAGRPAAQLAELKLNVSRWHYAKAFAPYFRLLMGSDGTLWTEHPFVAADDARRYVVYDTAGRAIARAEFPARVRPLRVSASGVLGVWKDSDDVPHVMLWRLRVRK